MAFPRCEMQSGVVSFPFAQVDGCTSIEQDRNTALQKTPITRRYFIIIIIIQDVTLLLLLLLLIIIIIIITITIITIITIAIAVINFYCYW